MHSRLLAFSLLALGAPTFGQSLFIVDAAGGPGAQFTDLQPAIDAAADGDVLLVRSGVYSNFAVASKGLTITADEGAQPALSLLTACSVSAVPSGSFFVLSGFRFQTPLVAPSFLDLSNCRGTVLLQGLTAGNPLLVGAIVNVVGCDDVIIEECGFGGALNQPAVLSSGSGLHVFGGTWIGGEGPGDLGLGGPAGSGLPALDLQGGTLFASGAVFQGGRGGTGGNAFTCNDSGAGGPGLRIDGGAQAILRDTTLVGGAGGPILGPGNCQMGSPGPPSLVISGSLQVVPGVAPRFHVPAVAREGQLTAHGFFGAPGDFVYWLIDLSPAAAFDLSLGGTLIDPNPDLVLFLGRLPAPGNLRFSLPSPQLPALLQAVPLTEQALFQRAGVGFLAADPRSIVLLDSTVP